MRIFLLVLVLLAVAALPAAAQGTGWPRAEVFFGASALGSDTGATRQLLGGWQGSFNFNFTDTFALAFDFGGQYRSVSGINVSQYEYMVGPRFTGRQDRYTVFAHALAGGVSARGGGATFNGAGAALGIGVDFNVGDRVAIRAAQFDYLPNRIAGTWFQDIRLGVGVVFKIGG